MRRVPFLPSFSPSKRNHVSSNRKKRRERKSLRAFLSLFSRRRLREVRCCVPLEGEWQSGRSYKEGASDANANFFIRCPLFAASLQASLYMAPSLSPLPNCTACAQCTRKGKKGNNPFFSLLLLPASMLLLAGFCYSSFLRPTLPPPFLLERLNAPANKNFPLLHLGRSTKT